MTTTLEDLMRISFNAGVEATGHEASFKGWDEWWRMYGQRRHDDYAPLGDPADKAKAAR